MAGARLVQGKASPCFEMLRNCLRFLLQWLGKMSQWKIQENHSCLSILLHVTLN